MSLGNKLEEHDAVENKEQGKSGKDELIKNITKQSQKQTMQDLKRIQGKNIQFNLLV